MEKAVKHMELLAPAGDAAAALAAFEAGADAVYAGLPKFNARERNPNFTFDSMARLIGHAHDRERRVYITFNTLLRENELPEAAEYLYRLTSLQPDAIIVQDIGLIRLVREFFPSIRLHASTQMGIHNSTGIAIAERMGITRVILERQVMLTELEQMMRQTKLEVEVFVHGALCCSLSGVCLFSSWLGGCSGNRGKCKQSCRREYRDNERQGNFFSPADLCLLQQLPQLYKLGISSLKIEGRLRRADYVRNAVSAYRLAIDAAVAGEHLPEEAIRILQRASGRVWSHGFTSVDSINRLIQADSPGVAGQAVAQVEAVLRDGIKVKVTGRMHRGDRIRLIAPGGNDESAFTLTTMFDDDGNPTIRLVYGQMATIKAPLDKAVRRGAILYKVGESTAAATEATLANIALPRQQIDLAVNIDSGKIKITLSSFAGSKEWQAEISTLPAKSRPLQPETVAEAFNTSNSEKVCAGKMNIRIAPGIFVPAGDLKKARQEFWRWAQENISDFELNVSGSTSLAAFSKYYFWLRRPDHGDYTAAAAWDSRRTDITIDGRIVVLPLEQWCGDPDVEILLPFFCVENDLSNLERRIRSAYEHGARRFRVTSLFHFKLLDGLQNIRITTSLPLPAANSLAAAELAFMGASRVQAWVELGKEDLTAMACKAPVVLELYRYGRFPVLITRAKIPATGWITDERNQRFEVAKQDKLTLVLAPGPIQLPQIINMAEFSDYLYVNPGDSPAGDFNFNGRWS